MDDSYWTMILKSQANAPYQALVWDMAGSKKIDDPDYINKNINLANLLCEDIKKIEQRDQVSILIPSSKDDNPLRPLYGKNPLVWHDNIALKIKRDTLDLDELALLFDKNKALLGINSSFHFASGYYETDDYELANKLVFSEYLIQSLSQLHKPENQIYKEQLNIKTIEK